MITEAEIVEAINIAILENHYDDMAGWTNEEHAAELLAYHPDCGDLLPGDPKLIEYIEAWRRQWPEAKAKAIEEQRAAKARPG